MMKPSKPGTGASSLVVARVSELDLIRIDFLERLERKGHSARVREAVREYLDRRGVPTGAEPALSAPVAS